MMEQIEKAFALLLCVIFAANVGLWANDFNAAAAALLGGLWAYRMTRA